MPGRSSQFSTRAWRNRKTFICSKSEQVQCIVDGKDWPDLGASAERLISPMADAEFQPGDRLLTARSGHLPGVESVVPVATPDNISNR
jgi:hypothetical protein